MSDRTGSGRPPQGWELLIMGGGLAMLVGSFLQFLTVSSDADDRHWNAWSNAFNLFPVSAIVVLLGVAAAGELVLTRYTSSRLSERVGGFSWPEIRLLIGFLSTLTMLGYLVREIPSIGNGAGLFIVLIGAASLFAGGLAERRQKGGGAGGTRLDRRQPGNGDWLVMLSGGAMIIGSLLTVYGGDIKDATGWASNLFGVFTVPVLLGAVTAARVAMISFGNGGTQSQVAGIEWVRIQTLIGTWAAMMMIGFAVSDPGSGLEIDREAGFWIMFAAALGLAFGAYMREREARAS